MLRSEGLANGRGHGSAATVARSRPAWRAMLAVCEVDGLWSRPAGHGQVRRDLLMCRLGRGDLLPPVHGGAEGV